METHASLSELSSPLQQWLKSLLRKELIPFPVGTSTDEYQRLIGFTADAGIQPLLWYWLKPHLDELGCPAEVAEAWQSRYLMERITARLRKAELQRVLTLYEDHKIPCLVLKGTALAHSIYPEPGLRPACDIDLFIEPALYKVAEERLLDLGYQQISHYNFETTYCRQEGHFQHQLDLHWKLSDSPFLGPLFDFAELYARASPLKVESVMARILNVSDALLHACTHIVGHREWDHLIWLLDIDLLARQLTAVEREAFIEKAIAKECAAVCLSALQKAEEIFGAVLEPALLSRLSGRRETSAYLLNPQRDEYREFDQLLRVSSWRKRLALTWQLFFPPVHMINARYKPHGDNSLLAIHARRLSRLPFRILGYYKRSWFG